MRGKLTLNFVLQYGLRGITLVVIVSLITITGLTLIYFFFFLRARDCLFVIVVVVVFFFSISPIFFQVRSCVRAYKWLCLW